MNQKQHSHQVINQLPQHHKQDGHPMIQQHHLHHVPPPALQNVQIGIQPETNRNVSVTSFSVTVFPSFHGLLVFQLDNSNLVILHNSHYIVLTVKIILSFLPVSK